MPGGSRRRVSLSHLLFPRKGSQRDVNFNVSLLVQGDHHRAHPLLPSRRGQIVNQLQCRGLVHCVGVGPVDANLKSFLDGGGKKDSVTEQSTERMMWGRLGEKGSNHCLSEETTFSKKNNKKKPGI